MHKKTIDSYNKNIKTIAAKHSSAVPTRLYELAKTFFHKHKSTLDLGCGIGRATTIYLKP